MVKLIKYSSLFFLLLISFLSFSQEGTRNTNNPSAATKGKIMIIPFEPMLYMSEIDQKINEQTKWEFETIRENFRYQLDLQLKLHLKDIAPAVSFYTDSTKRWKDLSYIYKSTDLSYDLVEKPTEATVQKVKQSGIKNGQLSVEVNEDKKFMNTKITNDEVLTYLNKKYETDYFVFINELDIKNDMTSYDMTQDLYQRQVIVHYSILDKTGKTIKAGIEMASFTSKENNPKKIVAQCFAPIATTIATACSTIINKK
jgi:hypothetical protein